MSNVVELAPVFAEAEHSEFAFVQGIWNARERTAELARARGHSYWRPEDGGVHVDALDAALAIADALVLAPTAAAVTGMRQPTDGAESGRIIGHRLLDRIGVQAPELHVILISHFLVGHGHAHRNAKPHTWGLRALEAHLRAGPNPWTILRPTWLSTVHDVSYQTRLTQDQHADGLVSTASIAEAVVTSVEQPRSATGRTAALYNLSIPHAGSTDLVAQFEALELDFEATLRAAPVRA